jgi:hypothetical protein
LCLGNIDNIELFVLKNLMTNGIGRADTFLVASGNTVSNLQIGVLSQIWARLALFRFSAPFLPLSSLLQCGRTL